MTHLLLVDDEAALLRVLGEYLRRAGYVISAVGDGSAALTAARERRPDLVVLDVTMPGVGGLEVLQALRAESDVPVIIMTALSDEADVLQGFELGADDYVVKPFSFAQLEARVRAVLARSSRGRDGKRTLRHGDLEVELDAHRVRRGGQVVKLTPTEFRLLVALMERPGRVMAPDELVAKVWGASYAGQEDYVRRYVWYLRRKIELDPESPRYILNERNVGYYFAGHDGTGASSG